jgi:hypothetical protein
MVVVETLLEALFGELFWPSFLVVIAVYLIRLLASSMGIQQNPLGLDLILFTYGFMCDLVVRAIQGQAYWQRYPKELLKLGVDRPELLSAMVISVVVLVVVCLTDPDMVG